MKVNGLIFANHWSAPGIEATGTKAEEMKVSGKTAMKPTEFRGLGRFWSSRPTQARGTPA